MGTTASVLLVFLKTVTIVTMTVPPQEHVSNKSAYLCGVMKTYRQKSRTGHGNTNGAPQQVQSRPSSPVTASSWTFRDRTRTRSRRS